MDATLEEIPGSDFWVIINLLSWDRNVLGFVYTRETLHDLTCCRPSAYRRGKFQPPTHMEFSIEFLPHLSAPGLSGDMEKISHP